MNQPILIPVQMTDIVTADQISAFLFPASHSACRARLKASTISNIKARARAIRPL